MNLFLDTADVADVTKLYGTGLIEGVTTSQDAITKACRNPKDVYRELDVLGIKHIHAELLGEAPDIVREALELVDIFDSRVSIKVPCTRAGLSACTELKKVSPYTQVNVTLVFSAAQAILATKSGADFVSVPVGIIDQNSIAGLEVVRSVVELLRGRETMVIADCIKDVYKVTRAFYNGADIVSMPPYIFEGMYDHVLTREVLSLT